MPLYRSNRERRLWLWAVAVVVAIYSTLGLAQTLAGILEEHELLDLAFFIGFFLVLATIATMALKSRPRGVEIGVVLGIAAVYLFVLLRMAIPAERSHLIEYGVLAVFIHEALLERASQGGRVPVPALVALLATAFLGLLDESIQHLLPNRHFQIVDVAFNALAGLMAIGASIALAWVRRWRDQTAHPQGK